LATAGCPHRRGAARGPLAAMVAATACLRCREAPRRTASDCHRGHAKRAGRVVSGNAAESPAAAGSRAGTVTPSAAARALINVGTAESETRFSAGVLPQNGWRSHAIFGGTAWKIAPGAV